MAKTILIVHAHPEPSSLTQCLVEVTGNTLHAQGHTVLTSDLYRMDWKAVYDEHDFPERADPHRLSFIQESAHSFIRKRQAQDIAQEQEKVLAADAVIFQFPLWWYGMPAIMKGWIDRVWAYGLAYGYNNAGNAFRYGDGAFKGKRALLSVCVGGPAVEYGPRGINGPLEHLLFPITHGSLYFPGFDVLPTFAVYGAARMTSEDVTKAAHAWARRVRGLFDDAPIAFRPQNGGDYDESHVLRPHVAAAHHGFAAHIDHDREA